MKIGIIGSGQVGQALAKAFLTEGHQLMMGSRDPSKKEVVQWVKENPSGKSGTFSETSKFGELLVLATLGTATIDVIKQAGIENFKQKVVIDATNPIAALPPTHGVLHFFTTLESSLMERIQLLIPEAKVVKAFNSIGNDFMYKPNFSAGKPTMFICGNDDAAKKTVADILKTFGWEPEDMGMVESARAIEPLCILWCIPGMLHNQWAHAFKLLKA